MTGWAERDTKLRGKGGREGEGRGCWAERGPSCEVREGGGREGMSHDRLG